MKRKYFGHFSLLVLFLLICFLCGCAEKKAVVKATPPEDKSSLNNMVFIPSGTFIMGGDKGEMFEGPSRKVSLDGYYIDKYEVTNALYQRFVNEEGYENQKYWSQEGWEWKKMERISYPGFWLGREYAKSQFAWDYHKADQPVAGVSWYEAEAFCRWAGKRLPTEAEWEKAARGEDGRTYPWGEEPPDCSYASYAGCRRYPALVGSYEKGKSPYGLYDTAGNVWEWVADWFTVDYFREDREKAVMDNPKGPEKGDLKTRKGGGWYYEARSIKTYTRWRNPPGYRDYPSVKGCPIGFRCAKDGS